LDSTSRKTNPKQAMPKKLSPQRNGKMATDKSKADQGSLGPKIMTLPGNKGSALDQLEEHSASHGGEKLSHEPKTEKDYLLVVRPRSPAFLRMKK